MSRLLPGLGAIHVLEFSWVLTLGDLGGAALPPHTTVWDWYLSLSPCPSCSHPGPNVWLSVLSSPAELMQNLGHWGASCPTQEIPHEGSFT